ncbi:MAG TPA: glutamine amidotransferase, partial [Longimicrobiales bacterium]|nr:glutamine amidotransferase [Longimicrobiales bacterium]
MESVFTFLFKYRPLLYEQGRIVLQPPLPVAVLVLMALAAAGLVAWTYRRPLAKARAGDRVALAGIRAAAIAVLFFCLLRPALLLSSVAPQQNYLGVLIDDSRSMRIADDGETARSVHVSDALVAPDAALLKALEGRFQLRFFRFSSDVDRMTSPEDLTFDGGRTSIAPALDRVREELGALQLSGVVLVTDGADAGGEMLAGQESPLSESLLALRAAGIPVYPVGVGLESYDRDVELTRVTAPRDALAGTSLVVDLMVSQTGYSGRRVTILVEDEGRIVGSEEVELPRAGEPTPVRVQFTANDAGARRFRFRVPMQDGERVLENNEQDAIINVRKGREKILYFEGEPRFEVAFLRRAVAADSSLQVVTLQRTADSKFMRMDVDSAGELVTGFPTTREELFAYRALVLGSIEASHFSHEQLRMIADFVSERGGGLLMLGGRQSFAEGGYAGTPVAEVLPVTLDARFSRDTLFFDTMKVNLTRAGAAQPAMRVAATDAASAERWRTLPELTTYNRVGTLKPGAVALLTANGRRSGSDRPLLAWQRYGRGQAFALPVQDTWIWQMHHDIPLEDMTHELFWRQLLRWLVTSVPDPVVASLASDHVAPGETVTVTADVSDERFARMNGGRVVARVTSPDGTALDVPMDWTVGRDGEYHGSFAAPEGGLYTVDVTAERDGRTLSARPVHAFVEERRDEYYASQMRAPLLRRIADETGGRFYTISNTGSLAEDIAYTGRGATLQEER